MNINISEILSAEIETAIQETAPRDFPLGDLRGPWEAGALHFLTVRDDDGALIGVLAYEIEPVGDGGRFSIIGMNAKGAPFAMRMMFEAMVSQADAGGASLSCWIEKPGMARIAERFGLTERARLYTRVAV